MPQKLFFSIPTLHGGGAERVLLNLLRNLNHQKYEIVVQTLFKESHYPVIENVRFCHVFPRSFRGNVWLLKLLSPRQLYRLFIGDKFGKIDVAISYLQSPVMRIIAGCDNPDVKIVNWIHNEFSDIHELSFMFRSISEFHSCMKKYDWTVFVAESARSSLLSLLPYLSSSSTIYNVIETSAIRDKARELIDDVLFQHNRVNLISVGRFAKAKAFDRLIHCISRLKNEGINAHLYLLGKGDLEKQYRILANRLGVSDDLTIVGFRDNPYKYVCNADLFVCSSLHEGYSTAVTEALVVGTPVLATDCSGMKELLGENGEYGVVTPNDEDSLYNALKSILLSPDMLKELKRKAVIKGDFFIKEKCIDDVEKLLEQITERKK